MVLWATRFALVCCWFCLFVSFDDCWLCFVTLLVLYSLILLFICWFGCFARFVVSGVLLYVVCLLLMLCLGLFVCCCVILFNLVYGMLVFVCLYC